MYGGWADASASSYSSALSEARGTGSWRVESQDGKNGSLFFPLLKTRVAENNYLDSMSKVQVLPETKFFMSNLNSLYPSLTATNSARCSVKSFSVLYRPS